jgi:hypothetical protein
MEYTRGTWKCRALQLQPSQDSSSQGAEGVAVPRFKGPFLANLNAGRATNSGTKFATTTSSKAVPRGSATKVAAAAQGSEDAGSALSFDVDADADALEEAMEAYD